MLSKRSIKLSFPRNFSSVKESNALSLHSLKIPAPEKVKPQNRTWSDVLFLAGLFGSGSNWRGIAKKLAEQSGVNCHLLDLRNHGSSPHSQTMAYEDMISDIKLYMKTNQLPTVALIGHSLGGRVSMQMCLRNPELISQLVVVDVAPVTYPPFTVFAKYIDYMKSVDLSKTKTRRDADEMLKPLLPDTSVRQFLLTNLVNVPNSSTEFTWRLNFDAIMKALPDLRTFPLPNENGKYIGPSLFLGGGKSDYIKQEYKPLLQSLFPNSKLVMIPDAGHWIHADKPDLFAQLVSDFFGKVK